MIRDVLDAYKKFEFYRVFQRIYKFCSVDLSSFYLDVIKDRLYAELPAGPERRSAQFVLARLHDALARLLAPILPHTAEELWDFLPWTPEKPVSVHLAAFPEEQAFERPRESNVFGIDWSQMLLIRGDILRVLEKLRADKRIGSAQAARVLIGSDNRGLRSNLVACRDLLEAMCMVSELRIQETRPEGATSGTDVPDLWVLADESPYPKCERCWNLRPEVGKSTEHPTLCGRCTCGSSPRSASRRWACRARRVSPAENPGWLAFRKDPTGT